MWNLIDMRLVDDISDCAPDAERVFVGEHRLWIVGIGWNKIACSVAHHKPLDHIFAIEHAYRNLVGRRIAPALIDNYNVARIYARIDQRIAVNADQIRRL